VLAGVGVEDISSMVIPGMEGKPGISRPRMGGRDIPPLDPNMLDIMEEELEEEEEEKEEKEEEDILEVFEELPMFMEPILLIILLIISSIFPPIPAPIRLFPPMPPPMDIMLPGMAPPDDIIVEEDDEDEVDLKLEIVDPSSDCVVAAIL